jgi:DNA ligase-1
MPKKTKQELAKGEIDLDLLLSHTFPLDKDSDGIWTSAIDATGWWISEKLDGVRAYWDPKLKKVFSRNGKQYHVPDWFTKNLPDEYLDGELWNGRQEFQKTSGIVRHKTPNDEDWKEITYKVFDLPEYDAPFEKRLEKLKDLVKESKHPQMEVVKHWKCTNNEDLFKELEKYEDLGAEGLMLRKPGSKYERKRSKTLLKIKSFYDSEAEVLAHEFGKGRLSEMCGKMLVKSLHEIKNNRFTMPKGIEFRVGSGMTDEQRKNPPPIGSHITYRFIEMTTSKVPVPRFATFVCVRDYD